MSVDFQQLQAQVKEMGEWELSKEAERKSAHSKAASLLAEFSRDPAKLGEKVARASKVDPWLRCALPAAEPMDGAFSPGEGPAQAMIIAADGSQINPDRHAEVDFSLINVGAIQFVHGTDQPPVEHIFSDLLFDERLHTPQGTLTEGLLALKRDLAERRVLLTLSEDAQIEPVITFTDGPIELWTRREQVNAAEYQRTFDEYREVLKSLSRRDVITAGYVDRPGANYVVRLIEVGMTPEDQLLNIRTQNPLRGAVDRKLFENLLPPGHRSAVFGLQSQSASDYEGDLQLHFFYLNVGRLRMGKIARVEIPAWVAEKPEMLDALHAILVSQARILGSRSYPYLLHRAHEAAVVTRLDKDQITQMILFELHRRGVSVEDVSEKQAAKNLQGRGRFP